MNDRERLTRDITGLEVREVTDSQFIGKIGGYAVVFNDPSENLGGFIEYVNPDAFDHVDMSDVVALYDHNFANVLGRTSAGTLQLEVDKKGLRFSLDIPNTTLGNDVYTNIRAGNLKGMSFGFTVDSDVWGKEADNTPKRTINSIGALYEVSVVTMPAYQETTVAVTRALNDAYKQKILTVLELYK
ncbi:HK97 family phage prohead protease [uncultured Leuconostoc sp.]|uniref:HK97 family phage prohead protease n=1 Tax=uncultured Leuconostoc sp. TaxID=173262 RepID=UPI0025EAE2CB|nr:HK97 family phage prohead protease [uncultured Leuconostoc sp.]